MTEPTSTAPKTIRSLPTEVGCAPKILREDGLFLSLSCGVCERKYLMQTSKWNWHRKKGTSTGLTCCRSCARKRWHLLNPGKSHFNNMPSEQRGSPKGYKRPAEQREAISKALKAIGHKPPVRKGNGTGMTSCEKLVREQLGKEWVWNFPVPLGKRQRGYPTNYKLDFANPKLMIGLEVDGNSHAAITRQAQDRKKETKLAELGWKVFRISNVEVAHLSLTSKLKEHLTTMLETDS